MQSSSDPSFTSRSRGSLLGLAAGDALGAAVEFEPRGTFTPVTGMRTGGPHNLEAGQWTDDTSMALCLAESLIERKCFDAEDQINRYVMWWRNGHLSSRGTCFDIGGATSNALRKFLSTGEAFAGSASPASAGNGSIMRLAPVPAFFSPDAGSVIHFSGESSKTTHCAAECIHACRLFGFMLSKALSGEPKEEVLFGRLPGDIFDSEPTDRIRSIADGRYRGKTIDEIRGSGYVVESLEAALWCFLHSESFEEAVLKGVNLGDDADTTGAVCGQIAGAFYGESGIPDEWLGKLWNREMIAGFAERLRGERTVSA